MEFELLGGESAGPTLRLDHEQFAYAGKFVMSSTGKTVVREDDELLGAVAFSSDTDDESTVRLRYVTVREDRRGEGIGPRLLRFTAEILSEQYARVTIAVNNPIAYEACYRAGFVSTGEETGLAELVLAYDPSAYTPRPDGERYREGLELFSQRDLPPAHRGILDRHGESEPPTVVDTPSEK